MTDRIEPCPCFNCDLKALFWDFNDGTRSAAFCSDACRSAYNMTPKRDRVRGEHIKEEAVTDSSEPPEMTPEEEIAVWRKWGASLGWDSVPDIEVELGRRSLDRDPPEGYSVRVAHDGYNYCAQGLYTHHMDRRDAVRSCEAHAERQRAIGRKEAQEHIATVIEGIRSSHLDEAAREGFHIRDAIAREIRECTIPPGDTDA